MMKLDPTCQVCRTFRDLGVPRRYPPHLALTVASPRATFERCRIVRGFLGLESVSKEDVRAIAVGFAVFVTLVQMHYWSSFNPFTPVHKASTAINTYAV